MKSGSFTRQVCTCEADEFVHEVAERMRENRVRRLPVVEGGRLAGIISLSDLARAAASGTASSSGKVPYAEVALTLAGAADSQVATKAVG